MFGGGTAAAGVGLLAATLGGCGCLVSFCAVVSLEELEGFLWTSKKKKINKMASGR